MKRTHSRNWTKSIVAATTISILVVLLRLFLFSTFSYASYVETFPSVILPPSNASDQQGLEKHRSTNIDKINKDKSPEKDSSNSSNISFKILAPQEETHWSIDTLQTVVWEHLSFPKDSTLDLMLLTDQGTGSLQKAFHKRYIPAIVTRNGCLHRRCSSKGKGSFSTTSFNLHPEIAPGEYSLVLTVFCRRSATVLGQAMVKRVHVVEDLTGPELESQEEKSSTKVEKDKNSHIDDGKQGARATRIISRKTWDPPQGTRSIQKFYFRKTLLETEPEKEPLELTHEFGGGTLVMRAPYTLGWKIPDSLEKDLGLNGARNRGGSRKEAKRREQGRSPIRDHSNDLRVNIVLITRDQDQDKKLRIHKTKKNGAKEDLETIVHVLATKIDAWAKFQFVSLPIVDKLLLSEEEKEGRKEEKEVGRRRYRIKVEVYGRGCRHVGYTHQFRLKRPAFYQI